MKKSWFHYSKDIIILGVILPLLSIHFFYGYLISLKYKGYNNVLLKSLEKINFDTFFIAFNTFIFSLVLFGSLNLMVYFGCQRKLISFDIYEKFNTLILRLGITSFILIFSAIGLNELQFSFFTGFVAFFSLIKPFIFKLK